MGEDTYFWLGASADAETGSREPSRVSPSRPVGFDPARWEAFADAGYWDLWCVRPTGERRYGCGFHLMHEAEARGLAGLLSEHAVSNPWKAS